MSRSKQTSDEDEKALEWYLFQIILKLFSSKVLQGDCVKLKSNEDAAQF